MRISVKSTFKAQLPKRNNNKTVVIELGKQKILKTLSLQKRLDTSRLNRTFNTSVDKQNLKSSRSIHKITRKEKPSLSLSKGSLESIKKSEGREGQTSRQTETIETLHSMIEELLEHKKQSEKKSSKKASEPSTQDKRSSEIKADISQSLIIQKVTNKKARKIEITLPFANLDLVEPQFWSYYEGELKNGARHGHGTLFMTNGEKFTGKFQANKASGNGTFYKKNGEVIIGVWKANKLMKRLC